MHLVPFQIRVYRSNHHSSHHKLLGNPHGEISAQTHQLRPEILRKNLAENIILKMGELTLSRKTNIYFENNFFLSF